ncbi:hypothetical protein BN13_420014 [Nostocoides jenkinsii Ben 74]|uniref:Uncharacterized protein n=1 Tax=Nostocoides jenkinsii Ben 74 TaxID=1193518 RepID=A0A077MCG0_9MICO|nr:hypothetical protein BN13_420014 [Tetrasphaera jenkinsii Ben 74]
MRWKARADDRGGGALQSRAPARWWCAPLRGVLSVVMVMTLGLWHSVVQRMFLTITH